MNQYRYKLNLQLFAGEGEEAEEVAELPEENEPEGIEWEPFDSDKPSEEKPEVADPEPEIEEKPTRDFEKDRAFADMRRRAEEAERRANAADDWARKNFGDKGINNWAEYQQALIEQQKREEYEEKGIDYDEVRKIAKEEADNHPDVLRAQEIERRYAINADIADLRKSYPDVQVSDIDDLNNLETSLSSLPNWEEIRGRLIKGYSLKDAYELANREEIISKRAAAAAQAERTKARSKEHMKPSGTGAADESISIPDETMRAYEKMFAKQLRAGTMKREDFIKHYQKSVKGG